MNQLFSIDLLGLKVVDVVSSDKIYPPHFKTVQNRQPVPEGAFKKRDGLVDGDLNSTAKKWECQLITPFFFKGSPNTDTIAAYSELTTDNLCHLFKNVDGVWSQITYSGAESSGTATNGSSTTLVQSVHTWTTNEFAGATVRIIDASDSSVHYAVITSNNGTTLTFPTIGITVASSDTYIIVESSIVNDGFYYVCNALTTVSNVITPVLILVKAESTDAAYDSNTDKNCCFAIYRSPSDGTISVRSIGNDASTKTPAIQTINWQSAMCAEYHLNKLWVGGLRETLNPDLIASGSNALVNRHNRIRWSKTGDWDTNYTGTGAGDAGSWAEAGTGYLDIPVTGEHRVVGLRQFRGQLYALTTSDLFIVTGTTSAQFGLTRICSSPSAVGQTMWASDNYLFWADANGIQMFNGSQVKNITEDTVPLAYKQKQIEQYDPLGTTVATGYGKVPTAFINEKLKIYGIHWPDLSSANYTDSPNLPGKETWLYNYKSQTFSTYVYNLEANYNDVNYVSDYHDTGFVWMGMCNTVADNPVAAKYTFEPPTDSGTATGGTTTTLVDSSKAWAVDEWINGTLKITDATDSVVYYVTITDNTATSLTFLAPGFDIDAADTYTITIGSDPGGAITTILETGDLNLAAMNGFSYEDVIKLNRVDFYVVPDSSTAITYKLDITIDNTAQAQQTVTVAAVSGATQPQHYVVPIPISRTGSFFKIKITEDTASVKGDLRRADLFYEVMFKRGGSRK